MKKALSSEVLANTKSINKKSKVNTVEKQQATNKENESKKTKSSLDIESEEDFWKSYDASEYQKPSVAVDVVAFTIDDDEKENYRKNQDKKLKIILKKRSSHPHIGRWGLPGSFVQIDETLEQSTQRIMQDITDISSEYLEQLYTWGELDRDKRHRIFSISYLTLISQKNILPTEKDYKWFEVSMRRKKEEREILKDGEKVILTDILEFTGDELSFDVTIQTTQIVKNKVTQYFYEIIENEHLAFDHAKIIAYAIKRLREKINYTQIAFSLMSEKFTLTQLQQVYEVILGKSLLKANFRRKIANMVEETDEYTKNSGHRPSKLYRFNNKFNF